MQHSFHNFGKKFFKITLEKCAPMVHNLGVYGGWMIAKASEGLSPYKDDPALVVLIFYAQNLLLPA